MFSHAEIVLAEVWRFTHSADGVLSRYFRAHHALGHADRGVIAETVFDTLRHRRTLEARCRVNAGMVTPRRLLLAALARRQRGKARNAPADTDERAWLARAENFDETTLSPAERLELPDWLHERLHSTHGEETRALAEALNRPAPLDLRVNTIRQSRKAVLARLAAERIAATPGRFSPFAIRLEGKPALTRHPLFLSGTIETQDEGSQLLGLLLNPKRGETVADFCAGAGGKTLLLGALMRGSGQLYAFDVSEKRLAGLKSRLERSGLSNVHPQWLESERDAKVKRLAGKFDKVLVDAPCSGLGTLRRNPDLKWRQTPETITEFARRQAAILVAAATLARPGGRLVYATCSLLPEENDAIVDAFLTTHPAFCERSAGEALRRFGWTETETRLRLLPHRHGTDGFFAALLERQGP
ncbi:MAG: RsmB/NOP family class I SAM-dependent RNA methyltransferase [Zoogloeaceae bacterium]|nr:RsmB/NOP family class I SAM-dependent RNA methyltransferase [Zoogloeaceae bacterium]